MPGMYGMRMMPAMQEAASDLSGFDMESLMGIDESMGDDYVEEHIDKEGHHIRKEVHKGNGFTQIHVELDPDLAGGDDFG